MRLPFTKVPFVLPRSMTNNCPLASNISCACKPEISGLSIRTCALASLPTTTSDICPLVNANLDNSLLLSTKPNLRFELLTMGLHLKFD